MIDLIVAAGKCVDFLMDKLPWLFLHISKIRIKLYYRYGKRTKKYWTFVPDGDCHKYQYTSAKYRMRPGISPFVIAMEISCTDMLMNIHMHKLMLFATYYYLSSIVLLSALSPNIRFVTQWTQNFYQIFTRCINSSEDCYCCNKANIKL